MTIRFMQTISRERQPLHRDVIVGKQIILIKLDNVYCTNYFMSIHNLRYSVVLFYFRLFEINSATIIDCVLVCRLLIIIIIITMIIIGQPECPVGGRRRHAASKIACIVLSSVRSCRSRPPVFVQVVSPPLGWSPFSYFSRRMVID